MSELLQDLNIGEMAATGNRYKRLKYDYDLISGKVNEVAYQPNMPDAFYHRYRYDAENRLIGVETSNDYLAWEEDARYYYYKHGPLARMELGQLNVQGVDYAYTLQGWLKGVNSSAVAPINQAQGGQFDMGRDGDMQVNLHKNTARDVYSFSLNYFEGDYNAIATSETPFASAGTFNLSGNTSTDLSTNVVATPLYNGNIASMFVNVPKLGEPLLYGYRYDQLNRIVKMDAFNGFDNALNNWANGGGMPSLKVGAFNEQVIYDPNGNILNYSRNAENNSMDDLSYYYDYIDAAGNKQLYHSLSDIPADAQRVTNRLNYVNDNVTGNSGNNYNDLQSENTDNYEYDAIGNLIRDRESNIDEVKWNVYGKIASIKKYNPNTGDNTLIQYTYDASGNRISKTVNGVGTFYVRDASGNVMAVYEKNPATNSGDLTQTEVHLYGSSRLGILNTSVNVENFAAETVSSFTRGMKSYELSNHLGNVLVTISDVKQGVSISGNGQIDYYEASILTANDYYPFGMLMPDRKFSATSEYRYGFNGQEKTKELGENFYEAQFWEYDSRIGRRWNVDPVLKVYESPYAVLSNNPIWNLDVNGDSDSTYNTSGGGSIRVPSNATNLKFFSGSQDPKKWNWSNAKNIPSKKLLNSVVQEGTLEGFDVDGEHFYANFTTTEKGGKDWHFDGFVSASTGKAYVEPALPKVDEDAGTVGKAGTMESMIPIWGSGRDAVYNFQKGNIWAGLGHSAMAISDVFLVKSIFTGLAKGGLKMAGSHTVGATRQYYMKTGFAGAKQPLHHWLIHNKGPIGKYVPDAIKNQMWNYKLFPNQATHTIFGHGKNFLGQPGANVLGQMWHGTPTWPKLFTISYGGRGLSATLGGN